jgi:uncharacterized membrane protein
MKMRYKDEAIASGTVLILIYAVLQIAFYKENPLVVVRTALGLFWLFYIPGYSILLIWYDKLDMIERSIAGIAAGATLASVVSYFMTLAGVPIRIQWVLIPPALSLAGVVLVRLKGPSR